MWKRWRSCKKHEKSLMRGMAGDKKLTTIAAMSDLTQLELPAGLAHKNFKALVQGVRLAKAIGGESKLFGDCITVGTLVEKLELESCTRWCKSWSKSTKQDTNRFLMHG